MRPTHKTIVFQTDDYRWGVSLCGAAAQYDPAVRVGITFESTNPAVLRLNRLFPGTEDCLYIPVPEVEEDYQLIEKQEFERIQRDRWQLEGILMEGPPGKLSVTSLAQAMLRPLAPGKFQSIRPKTWTPTKAELEDMSHECVVDRAENIPYALAFLHGLGLDAPKIEVCDELTEEETIIRCLSPHVKLIVGPPDWIGTYATYCTYQGFDYLHKSPAVIQCWTPDTAFSRFNVMWPACHPVQPGMPPELIVQEGANWAVRTKYRHDDIKYLKDVARSKQEPEPKGVSDLPQPSRGSNQRSRRGKKARGKSSVHSKG